MFRINQIFEKYKEIKQTLGIPETYAFMVGYGYVILDTKESYSLNNSFVHYIDSVLNENTSKSKITFPSISPAASSSSSA